MRTRARAHCVAFASVVAVVLAGPVAWAAEPAPSAATASSNAAASVPAFVEKIIPNATLLGKGRLRYFGFHIYDGQLFVAPGFSVDNAMATPFALDFEYARHFTGPAISRTALDEFERMEYGTDSQRAQWYGKLLKLMPDVEKGQHLTGVSIPGQGMQIYSNGVLYGEEHDPEFTRAFFAIWLDRRTKAPGLRADLLGLADSPR